MVITRRLLLGAILLCVGLGAPSQERFITLASTTSTEQSGLFGYLLPIYEKETGIRVRVVALGTGQALDVGRRGDADVVFVHAREAEQKFLAEGQGVKRFPVMYNDFVLIGPKSDPARIGGGKDISKLDHWWGAGWRLANASGFPVRTSAASEGPSPVDRVLLVVEQD